MRNLSGGIAMILFAILVAINTNAQVAFNPVVGCVQDVSGNCVPTTLLSAVPFLRIIPDARSGAMGDVGIGLSADPNAMHFNASKLVFAKEDVGLSASYTPWLRSLGLNDVYLTYLSGYRQLDDLQTVGGSLRFFSLGEINFTDPDGNPAGTGKPREVEVSVAYARKLSENFSAGLTAKYIYSNLASGQRVGTLDINSANAFAADLSMTYVKDLQLGEMASKLTIGTAFTNIGSKISYSEQSQVRDFLPMNWGLGAALDMQLDEFNQFTVAFDMNKLLVPSPVSFSITDPSDPDLTIENPDYDSNQNGIADFREKSMFSALLGSFGDAQGGVSEELKELAFSLGVEYWYDKQFAVRAGYYYENPLKGDRQFLTAGFGVKYNVFGLNLSYLVPTSDRRNPLDNTLRFTLNFDLGAREEAN